MAAVVVQRAGIIRTTHQTHDQTVTKTFSFNMNTILFIFIVNVNADCFKTPVLLRMIYIMSIRVNTGYILFIITRNMSNVTFVSAK